MVSNGSAASGGSAKDASCLAEAGGSFVGTMAPSTAHPAGPFRHRLFPHSARRNAELLRLPGHLSRCWEVLLRR